MFASLDPIKNGEKKSKQENNKQQKSYLGASKESKFENSKKVCTSKIKIL